MSVYAIGDIHGGLKALLQVLNKVEVQDNDTLIFVGDYVDGWSESAQVIQFLLQLSQKINCIFIKGNHDVWCEKWLQTDHVDGTWYIHGGKETIESYVDFSDDDKKKHIEFFKKMPLFFIDGDNRLFIHAGFTSQHGVARENFEETFYLDRTLWEMALVMDKTIKADWLVFPNRLKHYKEIFIGHTPTTNFNFNEPTQAVNVWNIDTGAAFKGKISVINVDTKVFYQSDPLPSLYPNEKGRNR